jgi:hypothetical protein
MKHTKEELTIQDKELINDIINIYFDYLDKENEARGKFIGLAHEAGEIASSGDKYENNIRFFEVSDSIKKLISFKKDAAIKLRNKLHYY